MKMPRAGWLIPAPDLRNGSSWGEAEEEEEEEAVETQRAADGWIIPAGARVLLFTQDKMENNKYSYHFIYFLPPSSPHPPPPLPTKMIYLEMYRVSTLGHCPDGCLSSEVAGGTLINDRSSVPLAPFYQSGGMHVTCKQFCFAFPFF